MFTDFRYGSTTNTSEAARRSYGLNAVQPELPLQEVERLCKEFKNDLCLSEEEISRIEQETCEQSNDNTGQWRYLRRCRLTASNFGFICKRRKSTPVANAVKSLLYKSPSSNVSSLRWGRENESSARKSYEKEMEMRKNPIITTRAGLVISQEYGFLGCSPDDWVKDEFASDKRGVAEYKCPYTAREISPQEACTQIQGFFCTLKDGELKLNRKHNYYYQVQGVMGITGRTWCDFVVWTPKGISIERIDHDPTFWKNMIPKLQSFFDNALLPELAAPEHPNCRHIRESHLLQPFPTRSYRAKLPSFVIMILYHF